MNSYTVRQVDRSAVGQVDRSQFLYYFHTTDYIDCFVCVEA